MKKNIYHYSCLTLLFVVGFGLISSKSFCQNSESSFQSKSISTDSKLTEIHKSFLNKDLGSYEMITLPFSSIRDHIKSSRGSSKFTISIEEGRTWTFEIYPNDLRSPNYKLIVADNGQNIEYPRSPNSTYYGFINGDSENFARVFLNNNKFSAWVNEGEESFYLEQIKNYSKQADQSSFVVYNIKDIIVNKELGCSLTEADFANYKAEQAKLKMPKISKNGAECISLKSAVAIDYSYVEWKDNSVEEAEAHVLEIFNLNSQVWEPIDIRYTLEETFIPASQDDDPFPLTDKTNDVLNAFTEWVGKNHWSKDYNINMILSAQDFGNYLGVAWVNTVCSERATAMNRNQRAAISMTHSFAHEWGHTWGCPHNGTKKVHVMPQGAGWTKLPVWTDKSKDQITETRNKVNCPVACETVGVDEKELAGKIKIFPNPANEFVQINLPSSDNNEVIVSDISGKIVFSKYQVSGKSLRIRLSSFSEGMYFIKVKSGNEVFSDKIILSK